MALKSYAKFEKKLTYGLRNDMRNFTNFHQNTWKCQKWACDGILLSKVENTWAKIHRGVMSNGTDEWWKFWKWIDLLFQNRGIWWSLTQALESLKNLNFDGGILFTKVCNVWAEKVLRSYLSWHWKPMWNLKKNWLVIWKMTWKIWRIFTKAL